MNKKLLYLLIPILIVVVLFMLIPKPPYYWKDCRPSYDYENIELKYLRNASVEESQIIKSYIEDGRCQDGSQVKTIHLFDYDYPDILDEEYSDNAFYCANDNQYLLYRHGYTTSFLILEGNPCS